MKVLSDSPKRRRCLRWGNCCKWQRRHRPAPARPAKAACPGCGQGGLLLLAVPLRSPEPLPRELWGFPLCPAGWLV